MSKSSALSSKISLSLSASPARKSAQLDFFNRQTGAGLAINRAAADLSVRNEIQTRSTQRDDSVRRRLNSLISEANLAESTLSRVTDEMQQGEQQDVIETREILRGLSHQLVDSIFESTALREKTQPNLAPPEISASFKAMALSPEELAPKLRDDFAGVRKQLEGILQKISEQRLERQDGLPAVETIDQAALFIEAVSLVLSENKDAAVEAQANLSLEKVVGLLDAELN